MMKMSTTKLKQTDSAKRTQSSTCPTEIIRHHLLTPNAVFLSKGLEIVLAAQVLEVFVVYGEVGGEHGCGDFTAVGAVADESAY